MDEDKKGNEPHGTIVSGVGEAADAIELSAAQQTKTFNKMTPAERDAWRSLAHVCVRQTHPDVVDRIDEISLRTGLSKGKVRDIINDVVPRVHLGEIAALAYAIGEMDMNKIIRIYEPEIWWSVKDRRDRGVKPALTTLVTSLPHDVQRREQASAVSDVVDPERIGLHDHLAADEVEDGVERYCGSITKKGDLYRHDMPSEIHLGRMRKKLAAFLKEGGTYVVFGRHFVSEGIVCCIHGLDPADDADACRGKFRYQFQVDCKRDYSTPLTRIVDSADQVGIIDTLTGKLIVPFKPVRKGRGHDGAIILVYRIPDPSRPGRDKGVIIVVLGIAGPGTLGAAQIIADPRYAKELFPKTVGTPLMRVVKVEYTRSVVDDSDTRDTRQIVDYRLLPLPDDDLGNTPTARAAAGRKSRGGARARKRAGKAGQNGKLAPPRVPARQRPETRV